MARKTDRLAALLLILGVAAFGGTWCYAARTAYFSYDIPFVTPDPIPPDGSKPFAGLAPDERVDPAFDVFYLWGPAGSGHDVILDGGQSGFHGAMETFGPMTQVMGSTNSMELTLPSAEGTIEMWIAPHWNGINQGGPGVGGSGAEQRLFVMGAGTWTPGLQIFIFNNGSPNDGGQLFAFWKDSAGASVTFENAAVGSTADWVAGQWHHVAFCWDATTLSLYLDGNAVQQSARPANPISMGWVQMYGYSPSGPGGTVNGWDGKVDDLAFWDEALYTGSTYTVPTEPYGWHGPRPPASANLTAYNNCDNPANLDFTYKLDPGFGVKEFWGAQGTGGGSYSITTDGAQSGFGSVLDWTPQLAQLCYTAGPDPIQTTFPDNAGTIEMWVAPNWNGTSQGGSGVGGSGATQDLLLFTDGGGNGSFRPGLQIMINNNNYPNDGGQVFAYWNDGVQVEYLNSSPRQPDPNSGIGGTTANWVAGEWHHIAVCWSETLLGLYLDGQVVAQRNRTNIKTNMFGNGMFLYGWSADGVNVINSWDGKIDDLAFYDAARYGRSYILPDSLTATATCTDVWNTGGGIDADFTEDCYVNLADVIYFAEDWLRCFDPCDADCEKTWRQR